MAARKTSEKAGKTVSVKPKNKDKSKSKAKTKAETGPKRAKKYEQPVVVMPSHDQIAERAYELWLRKGRPQGQDAQNWDEARRELTEAG